MQQLGGADPVDHFEAAGVAPGIARGQRQRLAGRHGLAQARQVEPVRQRRHLPVEGGRGEAHRRMVFFDRREQRLGAEFFQQHAGRADPQREQQQPAQAEGERQRRGADEDIVGARSQGVRREAVADGQHVAMEMHGPLRDAGGARGEADQADIVRGGIARRERVVVARHQRFDRGRVAAGAEAQHRRRMGQQVDLAAQAVRAQHCVDAGLADDLVQFERAQQRHGRHRDAAGLDHGQDAGGHHRVVGAAQQHAVAADQPEVAPQHVGDAVDPRVQPGVGQGLVFAVDRDALAAAALERPVEQFGHAVQARRILQAWKVEMKVGPLFGRRQVRAREIVLVGRGAQCCGGHAGHGRLGKGIGQTGCRQIL